MKKDINEFIKANQKIHFLRNNKKPNFLDAPIAIYINNKYKNGTFKLESVKRLNEEYFIKNDKLYYIHKEHKRWGEVFFITHRDIGEDIKNLQFNLLAFALFSLFFIVIIAYLLGKIFLKPMSDVIKSLEEFITDATHEINTPISNILINIELSKELYPIVRNSEEFTKIENSAFRVSKIFKDLSFLKFENNQIKERTNLAVSKVLLERLDFFKALVENKNLQIDKNIEAVKVEIDKEDLIRLIDNLLSNAIKYTKNSGLITITLKDECIEIINDGEIKNEKKVLKKFARENKNEGGFGLGLYIVRKICNTYGFKFTLKSLNSRVISKIYF
ncbi:MAG: HAMP domain-containing histidine kinase [Sulfurimonas sp.]|nr:HAMP domain-containing histidine kinase [Sulfurimonas sp.]